MMATALAVAFVVYSCKGKLGEAEVLNLAETPVQIVEDMFMQQTENGMIKMRAESPRMEKYEKDTLQYELFPDGFFVYAFDESGKLETEIVADNARHMKYKDGRDLGCLNIGNLNDKPPSSLCVSSKYCISTIAFRYFS